jgi:hypothetical protein
MPASAGSRWASSKSRLFNVILIAISASMQSGCSLAAFQFGKADMGQLLEALLFSVSVIQAG